MPWYSRQPVGSRNKATLCKRTPGPINSGTAATHDFLSVLTWSHSVLERRCRRQHEPASQSENIASHATSVARPSGSWRQSGRLTRTRVEFSRGMLTAAQKGRIRSADRTEVHLMTTTRFDELALCPSMRTSGVGKEVRHAGKTPSIEPQPRSSQVSS